MHLDTTKRFYSLRFDADIKKKTVFSPTMSPKNPFEEEVNFSIEFSLVLYRVLVDVVI